MRKFFGVTTDDLLHLKLLKMKKGMQYSLNYSGTKFFAIGIFAAKRQTCLVTTVTF